MKISKIYLLIFGVIFATSACELNEDPKIPNSNDLFSTIDGAQTVLNGCYSGMADFNYYGADFHHLTDFSSGLFNSSKRDHYTDILAFNIMPSLNYVENFWTGCYRAVARANNLIENLQQVSYRDTVEQENILGQAYFLRGLTYFNLVRVYGGVPLHTQFPDAENLFKGRASVEEVYAQVIADMEEAAKLLRGLDTQSSGRPANLAAHFVLAKVYMTLASNPSATNAAELWQKAYDEAIQLYGKYKLVGNYSSLWVEATSDNTSESIFEIQGNIENTLRLHQLFTPSNGNKGRTVWGRIRPNIECYDLHAAQYPNDPRMASTFLISYPLYNVSGTATTTTTYPTFKTRGNGNRSYPYLYKYYIKDHTRANYYTTQNFVVYRYADLLLMLAEIENELNGPDNAYIYVNEVLLRARNSATPVAAQPADLSGLTQEQFRARIMQEYRYELLGEGHEFFNERRRGWDHFKINVIDAHNNFSKYDFTKEGDVKLNDSERSMLIPIPETEIINNPLISNQDQNPGY